MTFRAAQDPTAARSAALFRAQPLWATPRLALRRPAATRSAARRAGGRSLIAAATVAALALSGCATQQGAQSNTSAISTATVGSGVGAAVNGRALAGWNGDISTPGMTAAHQSLPLGSYARVTNLTTGQSAVVQITSFLPLGRDRDIDLSRDAAAAIGALQSGVAAVTVAPLGGGPASATGGALTLSPAVAEAVGFPGGYDPSISTASIPTRAPQPALASPARAGLSGARFLQVGSFQGVDNARRLAERLRAQGLAGPLYGEPSIETVFVDGRVFHRVRLGPIADAELAAQALSDARTLGHGEARIMTP